MRMSKRTETTLCVPWLAQASNNVYSQFGEDGLIAAVLDRIGATNQQCFEVGAYDGTVCSNARALIEQEWLACLIEKDDENYAKLSALYADNPKVSTVHSCVFPWTIDDILNDAGCVPDMDLGVIDIDEQDFWVWAGMQRYVPRVMLVEYAAYKPRWQIPMIRSDEGEADIRVQAGLGHILALGVAKGYVALAQTPCNVLFARKELVYG